MEVPFSKETLAVASSPRRAADMFQMKTYGTKKKKRRCVVEEHGDCETFDVKTRAASGERASVNRKSFVERNPLYSNRSAGALGR